MKTLVVDASVVLGYLLGQNRVVVDRVESLLKAGRDGKTRLISICLLPLEVGNGLRFTLNDVDLAEEAYKAFLKLPIELVDLSGVQLRKTLGMAYKNQTTFYDSAYHVLAIGRRAVFLTCDKKYYRKSGGEGGIELLE